MSVNWVFPVPEAYPFKYSFGDTPTKIIIIES